MARADKLKGLKMPKPMAEEELDTDLEDLEMEDELGQEDLGLEEEEGELEAEAISPLEDFADQDLIDEMLARGLLPEDYEAPMMEDDMTEEDDLGFEDTEEDAELEDL